MQGENSLWCTAQTVSDSRDGNCAGQHTVKKDSRKVSVLPARMKSPDGKSMPMDARKSSLLNMVLFDNFANVYSEIVFNPVRYWFTRGPLTKLFRQFLVSPMPTHTKWGVLAYMASYYAFALAWSGTILNFVLIGVFAWNDAFCEYHRSVSCSTYQPHVIGFERWRLDDADIRCHVLEHSLCMPDPLCWTQQPCLLRSTIPTQNGACRSFSLASAQVDP